MLQWHALLTVTLHHDSVCQKLQPHLTSPLFYLWKANGHWATPESKNFKESGT